MYKSKLPSRDIYMQMYSQMIYSAWKKLSRRGIPMGILREM